MKLEYAYDQDPRYGWYILKVEERDASLIEVVVDDVDGGTMKCYLLNAATGEFKPTCMCNAWNGSECGCGNYGN